MSARQITVPFKVPNLFGGFADGHGLAKATPEELALQFVVKENLLDILKSGIKEIHIPQSEIDFIQHKTGWFGDKLRIRVKSMKLLADLPGCDNGEVTLHVRRRERGQVENFIQVLAHS